MLTTLHCPRNPAFALASVVLCGIFFFLLDSRKETLEGEELWHLASLRLAFWNTQHVQGVP
jgi:hypothetical protein